MTPEDQLKTAQAAVVEAGELAKLMTPAAMNLASRPAIAVMAGLYQAAVIDTTYRKHGVSREATRAYLHTLLDMVLDQVDKAARTL